MSLLDKLTQDMKAAMKAGDKDRLATIRLLRGNLKDEAMNQQKELSDEEELDVLSKAGKKRRESIQAYKDAGREDLAEKESKELKVIEAYLPQPLSHDEVAAIVDAAIDEVGAQTMKDMGKVMPVVMKQVKGRADGKVVNELVRQKLGM